ncbi:hypothetical protein hmeg3_19395 [Herbaspirillum sp. meg3]|nr:hypothetical protein hmeg3_19395 [Herbaspirillum sp. meg3]
MLFLKMSLSMRHMLHCRDISVVGERATRHKTETMRKYQKITLYCIAGLSLLVGLSWPVTSLLRLPSPTALLGLALELRPFSQSYVYFDSAPFVASANPQALQTSSPAESTSPSLFLSQQVAWRNGATLGLAQFLSQTHTDALLVIHRGQLVQELYPLGATRETVFPSYSVAKSILSDLTGIAVQEGKLSLSDPVRKYLPYLPEKFDVLKVNDLLNMHSGIHVDEKYDSVFSQIAYMYITTDLKRFVRGLGTTQFTPGEGFVYRSIDYLLLGMVLSVATGEPLTRYLQDKLWQPMGAQYPASWSVDSDAGAVEKSFCCINARAIDFARFGLLHLRRGQANGTAVLPESWMRRPEQVGVADADFAYGRGWWLPRRATNGQDYTAIGIHGQYVYIDPVSDTVIVKLSDHGAEQDEALTVAAFRSIVASLSAAKN